jgi:hypothetical protein
MDSTVKIDLKALLEPYSEGGHRTIEGQIKWLVSKGIPREHVDKAILTVYKEMHEGRVFPTPNDLDQELLRVAKEHHTLELSESVAKLEHFFNNLKVPTLSRWHYLKAFFTGKLDV